MEETLGKRIASNRKRLAITQDRLAEQLGVTAQAVSKWENDQSCPDITMLPKLASLFGVSVDALLGLAEPEKTAEIQIAEGRASVPESGGANSESGHWEFHWDGGRKPRVWFAVWVLLMGFMMLFNHLRHFGPDLWPMAWTSALMIFGLSGLYPRFSFFRLGCALFGGYFLLEIMEITYFGLAAELLLIIALLLFGLSLLVDALRRPEKPGFSITHNGKLLSKRTSGCTLGEDSFDCAVSFGEDTHRIELPLLRTGHAAVSFGESNVDLSGCMRAAEDCHITAECSFGELTIRVPRRYRVELARSASFASVEISGHPDPEPEGTIFMEATASFGEICIIYI